MRRARAATAQGRRSRRCRWRHAICLIRPAAATATTLIVGPGDRRHVFGENSKMVGSRLDVFPAPRAALRKQPRTRERRRGSSVLRRPEQHAERTVAPDDTAETGPLSDGRPQRPLPDRTFPDREEHERNDEGPEIALARATKGEAIVRRPRGEPHTDEQEPFQFRVRCRRRSPPPPQAPSPSIATRTLRKTCTRRSRRSLQARDDDLSRALRYPLDRAGDDDLHAGPGRLEEGGLGSLESFGDEPPGDSFRCVLEVSISKRMRRGAKHLDAAAQSSG